MVRMILFICLLASSVAQAKRIKIFPVEPMLGQAVTLSMPADIFFIEQRFNWKALEKCFAVFKADYGSERVRFTLYPYRPGPCDIKREKWETWEVPSHFNVRPNPDVQIQWQLPKSSVFVREAIHWQAKVQLPSESGYKAWFEVPEKAKLSYRFNPPGQGMLHAVAFSEQTGQYRLYSPLVTVKNPSGQVWRFPAPSVALTVRPLPAYLPANITVGRVQALQRSLPKLLDHSSLSQLQWQIEGSNLSPDWLPDLRPLRPVEKAFRWLIADRQTAITWSEQGMHVTQRWQQPIQWLRYGPATLPAMRVPYFDPEDEKLHDAWLPAQTVWVLPRPVLWALYGLAGVLSLLIVLLLVERLWQWGWYGWLLMQKNKPAPQLWRAMLTHARWIRFWRKRPLPKTPREWLQQQPSWIQRNWRQYVNQLNHSLFGQNHPFG